MIDTCLGMIFNLEYIITAHISRHKISRVDELVHKHQAAVLIMVYHIFLMSRCFCLANLSKAGPEPATSATNEIFMQAKVRIGESLLLIIYKILEKG